LHADGTQFAHGDVGAVGQGLACSDGGLGGRGLACRWDTNFFHSDVGLGGRGLACTAWEASRIHWSHIVCARANVYVSAQLAWSSSGPPAPGPDGAAARKKNT